MRANAESLAPDPADILIDRAAFFRGGRSGAGRSLLTPDELDGYHARIARLVPKDLAAWLHESPGEGTGRDF